MIKTKKHLRPGIVCLAVALLPLTFLEMSFALDTDREDVQAFMDNLASNHGFETDYLQSTLSQGETKQKILDAISRPAERVKPWYEYRDIFITPKRINGGAEFFEEHNERLARISSETGVPAEIITAIIGVETFYGRITGTYRGLDSLGTLAFDYPPRSKFFRSELEQMFLLAREEGMELTEITGSYAGAMGPPQFIPSSYRHFAVDGDGDGRRDLLSNWDDILSSVANYFVANGWQEGQPVVVSGSLDSAAVTPSDKNELKLTETVVSLGLQGIKFDTDVDPSTAAQLISLQGENGQEYWVGYHNFYVITRYNRSVMYAMAVYQLSKAIAEANGLASNDQTE